MTINIFTTNRFILLILLLGTFILLLELNIVDNITTRLSGTTTNYKYILNTKVKNIFQGDIIEENFVNLQDHIKVSRTYKNMPKKKWPGLFILDIDGTLIDSYDHPINNGLDEYIFYEESDDDSDEVPIMYAYKRPGADDLIKKLMLKWPVAIWTAAGSSWANFVIKDMFNYSRKDFQFVWTRSFTTMGVKELKTVQLLIPEVNINNIIMFDDAIYHKLGTIHIKIKKFDAMNDYDDNTLIMYLEIIDGEQNILTIKNKLLGNTTESLTDVNLIDIYGFSSNPFRPTNELNSNQFPQLII